MIWKNINSGANVALSQLPVQVPINKEVKKWPSYINNTRKVEVNYALISNPVFGNGYMAWPDAGTIFHPIHKIQVNSIPLAIPKNALKLFALNQIFPILKMLKQWSISLLVNILQIPLVLYTCKSVSFSQIFWFVLGKLETHIFNSQIPSWAPIKLNTSSFKCKKLCNL